MNNLSALAVVCATFFGFAACSQQTSQPRGERPPVVSNDALQTDSTHGLAAPVGNTASSDVPGATSGGSIRHHNQDGVASAATIPAAPLQHGVRTAPIDAGPSSANMASNGGNATHHHN
jgi:hypothetical protein